VIWIEALAAAFCLVWLYLLLRWITIQLRRGRDLFGSFYRRETAAQVKRRRTSRP
jgi:hypothetical protein